MLFGLYLGQRLGDLAKLTWRAVDLDTGEIAFTTRKTGRRIVLPLVQPLADYVASLPANDNPDAFIFPNAASAKRTGSLSNQFREILVEAGLVAPLTHGHQSTGKGRTGTRKASEITSTRCDTRRSRCLKLPASPISWRASWWGTTARQSVANTRT